MRQTLKQARESARLTQKQTANILGICERYYQKIEAGDSEGRCTLWDELESIFKIPQRELRKTSKQSISREGTA